MDNIKEEKKTDEELIEEVKKEAEAKKLAEARKLEEDRKIEEDKKAKNQVPIRNVFSKELQADKYFYKGIVPPGFEGTCGKPVDREELIEVFHKVFKPKDNILFY